MGKIMVAPAAYFAGLPRDVLVTDRGTLVSVEDAIKLRHSFVERSQVEEDPTLRQPIPYVLVRGLPDRNYVLMQRMRGQGEGRLAGKYYVGAGGHVEEGHTVFYTALKECTEELGLPLCNLVLRGVLITTGGPVEDVHLCMFYTADTEYQEFTSPEGALHEPRWATTQDLAKRYGDMERWSQVVVRDWLEMKL